MVPLITVPSPQQLQTGRQRDAIREMLRDRTAWLHLFLSGNFQGVFHIMPHNKMWSHPSLLSLLYQGPGSINSCSLSPHVPLSHLQTPRLHPRSHCQLSVPHYSHLPGLTPENLANSNRIQFYPRPLMDPKTI